MIGIYDSIRRKGGSVSCSCLMVFCLCVLFFVSLGFLVNQIAQTPVNARQRVHTLIALARGTQVASADELARRARALHSEIFSCAVVSAVRARSERKRNSCLF